jgi:hypothetical protein
MEGYEGICCVCFEPVREGDGVKFRESGRVFHKSCSKKDSYYVKLEKRLSGSCRSYRKKLDK